MRISRFFRLGCPARRRTVTDGGKMGQNEKASSFLDPEQVAGEGPARLTGPRRELQDRPRAPHPRRRRPGRQALEEAHHAPVGVQEDRVDGEAHEEHVDAGAGLDEEALAGRQPRPPEEPLEARAERPRPRGPVRQYSATARVHHPEHRGAKSMLKLKPLQSPLHLVLVSPQIPPNTGNVARLCAVTGCKLVLVEPLGFSISDKELKRAGLDYWDKVFLKLYPTWDAYVEGTPGARRWLFTARAGQAHWDVKFAAGD